jgi:hypothetical protein
LIGARLRSTPGRRCLGRCGRRCAAEPRIQHGKQTISRFRIFQISRTASELRFLRGCRTPQGPLDHRKRARCQPKRRRSALRTSRECRGRRNQSACETSGLRHRQRLARARLDRRSFRIGDASRLMPSRFPIRAASPFRPPVRHGLVVGDGAPNVAGASQDQLEIQLEIQPCATIKS